MFLCFWQIIQSSTLPEISVKFAESAVEWHLYAVDFLVKNGYLIRQADPDDRRIWRLLITEKSTEIILTGKQIQQEFGHQLTEGISEKDLKVYMEIAEKFKENILKIVQK